MVRGHDKVFSISTSYFIEKWEDDKSSPLSSARVTSPPSSWDRISVGKVRAGRLSVYGGILRPIRVPVRS